MFDDTLNESSELYQLFEIMRVLGGIEEEDYKLIRPLDNDSQLIKDLLGMGSKLQLKRVSMLALI